MVERGWIFLVLAALAVIAGILAALAVRVGPPAPAADPGAPKVLDLVIGTPVGANIDRQSPTGQLQSKPNYRPTDGIALRLETTLQADQSADIGVRLVRDDGTFMSLMPASFAITGPLSGYCCWVIPETGRYNLQVFRPDGNLSSLPIRIHQ